MLEMLGVLGALVAGAVGGLMLSPAPQSGDDDDDGADPVPEGPPDLNAVAGAQEVSSPLSFLQVSQPGGVQEAGYTPGAADLTPPESSDLFLPQPPVPQSLTGSAADEQIYGSEEADLLQGGGGNDTLAGGGGHDILVAGQGDDYLAGQEGDDTLSGGGGRDTLVGGAGNDRLTGGAGESWLSGGLGDDLLRAGPGNDTLDGDEGNDTLIGNDGTATPDSLRYLNAGSGDDVLHIGAGDLASGGAGADSFVLAGHGEAQVMDYEAGDHLVLEYSADHPAPVISYQPGDGGLTVLADGEPLARLAGVQHPDQVTLRFAAI